MACEVEANTTESGSVTVALDFDGAQTAVSELISAVLAVYEIADLSIVEPGLEGVVHQIYSAREVVCRP